MIRYVVVAAVLLGVGLTAQDGAASLPNPFANDPFWNFHVGSVRHMEMAAKARSPKNPVEAIEANFVIGSKQGAIRAARGLLDAPPAEFARGVRMLIERGHEITDDGTGLYREFQEFVADARKRAESFSGEDGADAAYEVLRLESMADRGNDTAHDQRVDAFRAKFAGTRAANAMIVSRVDASRKSSDIPEWMRRYRELAREYDGTEVGAMAAYYVASRQANCCNIDNDEVARLLEVFDIVKRLESGRFPRSYWVEQAPQLIYDFYWGIKPQITAEAMPELYDRYLEFVLAHPRVRTAVAGSGVEWLIRNSVGRLAATPVERVATVERFLDDLEKRGFGVTEVRLQRARFYLSMTDPGWISDHLKGAMDIKEAEARAVRALRTMIGSQQPAALVHAYGLLANYYFSTGQYESARANFAALQAHFPTAEWNWVAALRLAQIHEWLDPKTAAPDYEAVALRQDLPPAAVLLARIPAAELREQSGELPAAGAHYRAALRAWESSSDVPHISWSVPQQDGLLPVFRRFTNLKKSDIATRVDRLSKAVTVEEALLYAGRRAIELDKPREALGPLKQLVESYPKSTAAVEGRRLWRRAQLSDILRTPQDSAAIADRKLAALATGTYDDVTSLAKLARAALKLRANASAEAEAIMKQSLEEWHAKQATAPDVSTALARDISAIRAALFLPQGGGIYGTGGGNGFRWPAALSAFHLVSRDIQIKTADGKQQKYSAPFAVPAGMRVIFVTYDDLAIMRLILDRVGGTETNEWTNALDLPNQPIGGSVQIAQLWSRFFPLRPGHWGGWELTVYPVITKITFDRDGHALADVTIGHGGGTYELEKENGAWVAKRMVSMWVT